MSEVLSHGWALMCFPLNVPSYVVFSLHDVAIAANYMPIVKTIYDRYLLHCTQRWSTEIRNHRGNADMAILLQS